MNRTVKKLLSSALSLAIIAGSIVLPTTAGAAEYTPLVEGDNVIKEWKFDFGAASNTPEDGYTLVTPETSFVTNKVGDEQYGFLGIGEEDYKLTDRYDGWTTQKGQVIELAAGGTAENTGIGVVGAGGKEKIKDSDKEVSNGKDIFGNKGDVYYPTRFALKVQDDTYYRIRATVTTLDPAKDAKASLYTERKHPLYTEKTISAGTVETTDFSVRVTPIYYEKSNPTGQIKDEMVTVGVLGENTALVSLVIQQVETFPTVWVLGDSTVTDGNTTLPFFPLQNYTGVGTGLTKYLRRDYAMVNEGEGGLNAADSNHFNMVKSRIKAGDYMYVEYGHNHKADGPTGYKACLDKYYNACHAVGAKLIIVSPVQSINSWNDTDKKWVDRFGGENNFAGVGKAYVAEKVAAGATDVAFADLTKTSVAFIDKVTADGGNVNIAAKFYYQTTKGGGTDASHPNDTGAENFAYCFFEAAKENDDTTQAAVLADLLANMTDEQPNLVPAEVVAGGLGETAWPQYIVPTPEKYPILIKDVVFNEDGSVKQVDVTVRDAEIGFNTYGVVVVTIYNADGTEKGKVYAIDQVDNSTGKGPQSIYSFSSDIKLEEGDTYSVVVIEADADTKPVEGGKVYSAVYKPTDIEKILITNEDNTDIEKFDFFGATYGGESPSSLEAYNGWTKRGSAGISLALNETNGMKYVEVSSDGAKNGAANQGSFYVAKDFVTEKVMEGEEEKDVVTDIGTTGRYIVSFDAKFVSGGGLEARFVTGNSDKIAWGTESITLFTIGTDGAVTANGTAAGTVSATAFTNVKYILDMDLGKAYITVGGGDETEVDVPNYQTESLTVSPSRLTGFMFGGDKKAFTVDVANLTVGKIKDKELPEYDFTVTNLYADRGTVSFTTPTPEPTSEPTTEPAPESELLDDEGAPALTVKYFEGKATVSSTAAVNAVLAEAEYNDEGALSGIKIHKVEIGEEGGSNNIDVAEGSKLMLWDSFDSITPLINKVDAVTVYDEQSESGRFALNTVITAKAVPNEGYVFMGWYNDKKELVSMDAEYTFRLRGDTTLSAKLVVEPTLADIKTFEVSAESLNIKASEGAATTMIISGAKDAAGTPMTTVKNSDMTWSCSEPGITVSADGVVTFGADFSMGGALTKDIEINASINGVTKSCTITAFGYEYFENMAEGSTKFDGLFMKIADKTAIVFPGENTTKNYTMGNAVKLDKTTTVKFDNVWSGANTCGQLRTLNFKNSAGTTIFSMYYSWGGLFVGGTELGGAVEKDKWTTVTVEINPETKVVTVTAGNGTAKTTLVDNAGDLAGIDFVSASSVPGPEARALGISNIVISK